MRYIYTYKCSLSQQSLKHLVPLLTLTFLLPLLRSLLLLPRRRTEQLLNLTRTLQIQPRANKHNRKVEEDVDPKDTIVAPHICPMHIKRSSKGIAISVLAESTESIGLSNDIASGLLSVWSCIGIACLSWRSRKAGEFLGIAFDRETMGDEGEEAFEEVFEWGKPVHPAAPEVWEGLVGYHDTAERYDEEEEHWYQQ
jgi:hypothetical protein